MEDKEKNDLVLWLTEQHTIAYGWSEQLGQPEKGLYIARAKAIEDVMRHIENYQTP